MSKRVALERLREQTDEFGSLAYVVTVNDDGKPHVVSAEMSWSGGRLVAGAGRRTGANTLARPSVTVLWPPLDDSGFSLLVDGTAELDDERVAITPETAILHRTASAEGGVRRSDCAEV